MVIRDSLRPANGLRFVDSFQFVDSLRRVDDVCSTGDVCLTDDVRCCGPSRRRTADDATRPGGIRRLAGRPARGRPIGIHGPGHGLRGGPAAGATGVDSSATGSERRRIAIARKTASAQRLAHSHGCSRRHERATHATGRPVASGFATAGDLGGGRSGDGSRDGPGGSGNAIGYLGDRSGDRRRGRRRMVPRRRPVRARWCLAGKPKPARRVFRARDVVPRVGEAGLGRTGNLGRRTAVGRGRRNGPATNRPRRHDHRTARKVTPTGPGSNPTGSHHTITRE